MHTTLPKFEKTIILTFFENNIGVQFFLYVGFLRICRVRGVEITWAGVARSFQRTYQIMRALKKRKQLHEFEIITIIRRITQPKTRNGINKIIIESCSTRTSNKLTEIFLVLLFA